MNINQFITPDPCYVHSITDRHVEPVAIHRHQYRPTLSLPDEGKPSVSHSQVGQLGVRAFTLRGNREYTDIHIDTLMHMLSLQTHQLQYL